MPTYTYKALTPDGSQVIDSLEADSQPLAAAQASRRWLLLLPGISVY